MARTDRTVLMAANSHDLYFFLTLDKLKNEIELLRKANMAFMNDSLRFLDEMISILTGGKESNMAYDQRSHLSKSGINCFLSREV